MKFTYKYDYNDFAKIIPFAYRFAEVKDLLPLRFYQKESTLLIYGKVENNEATFLSGAAANLNSKKEDRMKDFIHSAQFNQLPEGEFIIDLVDFSLVYDLTHKLPLAKSFGLFPPVKMSDVIFAFSEETSKIMCVNVSSGLPSLCFAAWYSNKFIYDEIFARDGMAFGLNLVCARFNLDQINSWLLESPEVMVAQSGKPFFLQESVKELLKITTKGNQPKKPETSIKLSLSDLFCLSDAELKEIKDEEIILDYPIPHLKRLHVLNGKFNWVFYGHPFDTDDFIEGLPKDQVSWLGTSEE